MRLIVARCEVTYTGLLAAHLPESTRLLMLKADGSVLVHADAGGYKPASSAEATRTSRSTTSFRSETEAAPSASTT
jgi:RecB family endonuclease NucS